MRSIAVVGLAFAVVVGMGATPALAQSAFLGADLLAQEVPSGGGDKDASGNFNGEIDAGKGKVCYYLDLQGLDDATLISIRTKDQPGTEAPAVTLAKPAPNGDEVCVEADKTVLATIVKAPGDYAIDVQTPGHPEGAVRGILKK
jgi:hypothetical protein